MGILAFEDRIFQALFATAVNRKHLIMLIFNLELSAFPLFLFYFQHKTFEFFQKRKIQLQLSIFSFSNSVFTFNLRINFLEIFSRLVSLPA